MLLLVTCSNRIWHIIALGTRISLTNRERDEINARKECYKEEKVAIILHAQESLNSCHL